jgi:hypothetical protein
MSRSNFSACGRLSFSSANETQALHGILLKKHLVTLSSYQFITANVPINSSSIIESLNSVTCKIVLEIILKILVEDNIKEYIAISK